MKKKKEEDSTRYGFNRSTFYPIYNFYFSSFSETQRIVTKASECGLENGKAIEGELKK
jgi:hypothetical protein